jgi:predicted metal-dependent hydrolase
MPKNDNSGNIKNNAKNMFQKHMTEKLGEYLVVHELLHFHVPNHGKLWKSLMRAYLGDYEKLEKKLKLIVQ